MAKGRRTVVPEAATERIMRKQLKAFRKKFGRDPLPGEPVFFDPDRDVPTEMTVLAARLELRVGHGDVLRGQHEFLVATDPRECVLGHGIQRSRDRTFEVIEDFALGKVR